MSRGPTVTAAAALAAIALAACRAPARPSSIRIAHESEAITLDPAAISEAATHSILSNIYEPLVGFDRDMAIVPRLAVSWGSVDSRSWQLELRKDVTFHDGTPMTATLVRQALARSRDGASATVRAKLSNLSAVEAVDERHIRLTTTRPDPLLMNRLAYVLIGWAEKSEAGAPRAVGTGPYRVVRWEQGRSLEAERWARYWGPRPPIERATFFAVEEGERSITVLERSEADVIRFVPEPLAARVRPESGARVVPRVGLGTYYLWCDSREAKGAKGADRNPFADVRVRQALSLAVDRREIVKRLGGFGAPANQLVQQGVFGFLAGLPELPFDRERARALLAGAGYPHGFSVTLVHRPGRSVALVADAVREMLGQAGIEVRLQTMDWAELVSRWQAGRLPFFLSGWSFDNGDALSFLADCLATRDAARQRGLFNPGYSDPVLDRLIEEQEERIEDATRLSHYETLMRTALGKVPLVPLFTRTYLFGVSNRVAWKPRLDGELLVAEMSFQ